MPMRVQEIHPALAHFPIALIPTAVAADLVGVLTGDRALMETGRRLMPLAAASVAATGIAGLVAQGAVRTDNGSHDLLVTHRNLNIGLLALTAVLAGTRVRRRRPGPGYLLAGLAGAALATYTGYLGGKMVYEHGVGVKAAGGIDPQRAPEIPGEGFSHAGRVSAENAAHAVRHTAHHLAEGEIAPALGQ